MGNAASKIINAVTLAYNGSVKIKTGKKTYARVDIGPANAANLVSQINGALSGRYQGDNFV